MLDKRESTESTESFEFKYFNYLSEELKARVATYWPLRLLLNLTLTSKSYHQPYNIGSLFFKPLYFQPIYDLGTFQYHAVRRRDKEVREILLKNIHFICKKGTFIDLSHRTFDDISIFEYAFWAKDKHFWTLMLDCIPHNEKGLAIIEELIAQTDNIEKNGITYELKIKAPTGEFQIKTITEKHFDFDNTIILELQELVDMVHEDKVSWNEADKKSCEGVGQAQNLIPMHVVHEYCAGRPFDPVPDFKVAPNELKQQFYNWNTNTYEEWYALDSGRGVDFAVYKGEVCAGEYSGAAGGAGVRGVIARDLVAIKALGDERTKDCCSIKSQLEDLWQTITQSLTNQLSLNG